MAYYNKRNRRAPTRKPSVKGKRPSHVSVYVRNDEYPERAIKRFLKKCKKEKVIEQYREYEYFEKPSIKRHRAKIRKKNLLRKEKLERESK